MFRVPYRWLPRTFVTNVFSMALDIKIGVCNVFRWIPVIWFDGDYDFCFLVSIMEYKLRRMSKCIGNGCTLHREKDAKDIMVCAELCRRINSEFSVYYDNADKRFPDKGKKWAEMISKAQIQDRKLLGKMIGKHLSKWWD